MMWKLQGKINFPFFHSRMNYWNLKLCIYWCFTKNLFDFETSNDEEKIQFNLILSLILYEWYYTANRHTHTYYINAKRNCLEKGIKRNYNFIIHLDRCCFFYPFSTYLHPLRQIFTLNKSTKHLNMTRWLIFQSKSINLWCLLMSFASVKQFVYSGGMKIQIMCHTFATLRYQTPRLFSSFYFFFYHFVGSYFANFLSFKLGITITIGDHQMIFDFELRKVKLYQYVHCFTWTYQIERFYGGVWWKECCLFGIDFTVVYEN